MTKKQWTIIGVIIALIAIWYFFLRKKTESNYGTDLVSPGCPLGCRADYRRNVCICG